MNLLVFFTLSHEHSRLVSDSNSFSSHLSPVVNNPLPLTIRFASLLDLIGQKIRFASLLHLIGQGDAPFL